MHSGTKVTVFVTDPTDKESPGVGVRLSTRGGLTRPHTILPSNQGPGVLKARRGGGVYDPDTGRTLS